MEGVSEVEARAGSGVLSNSRRIFLAGGAVDEVGRRMTMIVSESTSENWASRSSAEAANDESEVLLVFLFVGLAGISIEQWFGAQSMV